MTNPRPQAHSLMQSLDGSGTCSCGEWFRNEIAALRHLLPLSTRDLADAAAADPKSSPELVRETEDLAIRAATLPEPRREDR